jgi:3'-5' exoribonuclease
MFPDIARRPAAAVSAQKGFLVAELVKGAQATGQVAVVRKETRVARTGSPFLSLLVSDRSGSIGAKDFEGAAEHDAVFAPGSIVKIRARVDEFNGQLQLLIERARPAAEAEIDRGDFTAVSAYEVEEMFAALRRLVESLGDEWLRRLLGEVLERYGEEIKRAPAAMRLHHPFAGGLLEHVLSMCRAATALAGHYDRLDCDLLMAGCVLHDLGKTRELAGGVGIEYSAPGKLVGHVAEGLLMLEECCRSVEGFPEQKKMLLRHLIVSHHGTMEFGALKLPKTPEAIALHFIDELDAKLEFAFRAIDSAGPSEFSPYEHALEREIYCVR